jgi:hypothetical protein
MGPYGVAGFSLSVLVGIENHWRFGPGWQAEQDKEDVGKLEDT